MSVTLGEKIAEGKTKRIYKSLTSPSSRVYIVSKDSITAGDGAKKDELPGKGIHSTTTTTNIFRLFKISGIATHYVKQVDGDTFEAVGCAMVPLEVIVRRRVTGSYLKRNPHLQEGARLEPCVVEFTFKDDQQHDPLVSEPEILAMKLKCGGVNVTSESLATMRRTAVQAFEVLEKAWELHDVVLVDFKVEFGVTAEGTLVLADVIDNDSWRIWPHGDRTQMKDKQVYRNIPKPGTEPTAVGTLNQDQVSMLVKNYEWVAQMSNRLLDVLGDNSTKSAPAPLVGIIMGSQSDWETMKLAAAALEKLGIPHEVRIVSAHRTPDRLFEYAKAAKGRGLHVIIAGAGGAAHLPGMVAALTPLPVLGVPVQSRTLSGVDSLLSIVQMPAGIPVGTLAIGAAGATNAALLAASILATKFPAFAGPLDAWRSKQTDDVAEAPTDAPAAAHGVPPTAQPVTSILSAATRAIPTPTTTPTAATTTPAPTPASSTKKETKVLPPGSTIGILGGGQLGRMTAVAAAQLGYRVHVFCPDKDPPAAQVANQVTTADYSDKAALDAFAAQVDVATYEFENIDANAVEHLAAQVTMRPDLKALRVCQDRIAEKTFLNAIGIRTAPFAPVANVAQLRDAVRTIGVPAVLKSNTLGYDGKGQVKIMHDTDLDVAWQTVARTGSSGAILEGFVAFDREVSVIVARGADGSDAAFPVVENEHRDHILYRTTVPPRAGLPEDAQCRAVDIARKVATGLDLVGVLAVEMFVVKGKDGAVEILVNELAPRPHNSGHWTIEGCATSQFEQVVRAACGLPLGSIGKVSRCEMTNLIGKEVDGWREYVAQEGVHLHIYGKAEAREGRKMGHVTKVFSE